MALEEPRVGRRIGVYETLDLIQEDGIGRTFLAQRTGAGDGAKRLVELTAVHADVPQSEAFRETAMEQARRASSVENAHFSRPDYAFQSSRSLHVVSEHRRGRRLTALVRERAAHGALLPPEVVVRIFADVSDGLVALHGQLPPLVHGDISPSNILVTPEGDALLLFSGLGALLPAGRRNERVAYRAPELLELDAREASPRSDVYACAFAMCVALLGRNPHACDTESETIARVLHMDVDDVLDELPSGVPRLVLQLLRRALSHDPGDRHGDARSFRNELLSCGVAAASPREVAAVVSQPALEMPVTSDEQTRVAAVLPRVVLPPPRLPPPRPPSRSMRFEAKPVTPSPMTKTNGSAQDDDAATLLYVKHDTLPPDAEHRTEAPPGDATEPNALPHAREPGELVYISIGGAIAVLIAGGVWLSQSFTGTKAPVASSHASAAVAPPASHAEHSEPSPSATVGPLPTQANAAKTCSADLAKDPQNCGACGNDCAGGKCNEGLCSPVVVASNRARPSGIALDGAHIYWTNAAAKGSVMKVSLAGGKPMTVSSSPSSPDGIAVDGKTVYWTSSAGSVSAAPIEGGKTLTVATKQDQPTAIVARAGAVYWTNQTGSGSVMKVKAAGEPPKEIASGVNMPCGVSVDERAVYFTSYGSGTVSRTGLDGGKPAVMASGQANPCNLAAHGDSLYWINTGRPSAVMKIGLAGGEAKALVSDIAAPSGLATDGNHVYWTTTDKNGAVLRVSATGGKPETLARGVGNPAAIAVSQGVLVFADYSGGDVFKLKLGTPATAVQHDHAHHAHHAASAEPAPAASAAPLPSAAPAASAAPPAASAAPAAAMAAAAPAAPTGAPDVELKLASKGNLMAFDQVAFTVKTGQKVKVVFQNVSTLKVMSHNWVLVKPGTEAKVAEAGLNAGEGSSYVPANNPDVIASTKLAGPGETVEVLFVAPAPGSYPFVCTMPGHYMVMKGTLTVTP